MSDIDNIDQTIPEAPVLSDDITADNVDAHLEVLKQQEAADAREIQAQEQARRTPIEKPAPVDDGYRSDNAQAKPSEQELANNYKAALHETRQQKKALNENILRLEQENKIYQQKIQEIQARVQGGDTDLKTEVENLKLRNLHDQTQREYQSQINNFVNEYKGQASEFQSKKSDFNDAYAYLIEGRLKEYEAMGYDRNQASQIVQKEEMAMVAKSFEDGANAAERIYNVAKTRGYVQKAPTPQVDRLSMLEQGVRANKSFANSTGSESDEDASYETLARFADEGDMESFNKVFEKMWDVLVVLFR